MTSEYKFRLNEIFNNIYIARLLLSKDEFIKVLQEIENKIIEEKKLL